MDDSWKHGRCFSGCRIRPTAVHSGQARRIVIGEDPVWVSYHHGRRKALNSKHQTLTPSPRCAIIMLCAINVRVQYSGYIQQDIIPLRTGSLNQNV